MAVPTVITDLSITAASNAPSGSDPIGTTLDDFLRADAAFIRQLFDTSAVYSATVGGTANAITLTPAIALTAYKTGQRIVFKATGNSSAAVTINVSGVAVKKAFGTDGTTQLTNGDISTGKYYTFVYDEFIDSGAGGWMFDASGSYLTSAAVAAIYAPLASPTFTGTPSLPTGTTGVTQAATDSSTKLATTAFVKTIPTRQRYLSGSGTYNVPSGCLWFDAELVGGGGGGGGTTGNGVSGNDTTFGSTTAKGGAGGTGAATPAAGGAGGNGGATGTGAELKRVNGQNGYYAYRSGAGSDTQFGGIGGISVLGVGGEYRGPNNTQGAGSGYGGGGGGALNNGNCGGGGGGGEYVKIVVTSPAASYSYSVGTGGSAGTGSPSGAAGAAGAIIITEYYIG